MPANLSSSGNTLQDVTPGKIVFTKPAVVPEEAKEQVALFKPADLRESSVKLRPGDKVEFSIVQQDSAAGDLATDITLLSRASSGGTDGKPLLGCVISVKEGFGFIRCATLHLCCATAVGNGTQPPLVCNQIMLCNLCMLLQRKVCPAEVIAYVHINCLQCNVMSRKIPRSSTLLSHACMPQH